MVSIFFVLFLISFCFAQSDCQPACSPGTGEVCTYGNFSNLRVNPRIVNPGDSIAFTFQISRCTYGSCNNCYAVCMIKGDTLRLCSIYKSCSQTDSFRTRVPDFAKVGNYSFKVYRTCSFRAGAYMDVLETTITVDRTTNISKRKFDVGCKSYNRLICDYKGRTLKSDIGGIILENRGSIWIKKYRP